eukprot:GHVT01022571.1.p1 GENE.GHVT01022571.1~~GHVT01022571.1.p1  ORF type:complete len:118 (-),score=10.49 GHVT01022571.1:526-879(-)
MASQTRALTIFVWLSVFIFVIVALTGRNNAVAHTITPTSKGASLDAVTQKLLNAFSSMVHDSNAVSAKSEFANDVVSDIIQLLRHVSPARECSNITSKTLLPFVGCFQSFQKQFQAL